MTEACYVMMGQLESTLDASPVWHLQVSNYLFLHLNRFPERHGDRGYRDKICGPCSVPPELTVGGVSWTLVGCVCHRGDSWAAGHYLAFTLVEGVWTKCDDDTVTTGSTGSPLDQLQREDVTLLW